MKLFTELLDAPAPPGCEERIAEIIRGKIEEFGFKHETDHAGNVMVRLDGKSKDKSAIILAAHMDEIALAVTNIEPDGRLSVRKSGGLVPHKVGERMFDVIGDHEVIQGVLSFGSTHAAGRDKTPTWDEYRIFTGLKLEQLKKAGVRPGSSAVPSREGRGPFIMGDPDDPFVAAWTFDDRMGVVALLRLLEEIKRDGIVPSQPLIVAFTVHEEGGCHGAKVLAQRESPEVFVAIDGCPITPEAPLKLDGRPGIWSMDRCVNYDQRLVRFFLRAADDAGTELQPAVYNHAFSDAGAVYDVGAAPRTVVIGQVRENSHGYEVARLSVFDNLLKTLVQFVRDWP